MDAAARSDASGPVCVFVRASVHAPRRKCKRRGPLRALTREHATAARAHVVGGMRMRVRGCVRMFLWVGVHVRVCMGALAFVCLCDVCPEVTCVSVNGCA